MNESDKSAYENLFQGKAVHEALHKKFKNRVPHLLGYDRARRTSVLVALQTNNKGEYHVLFERRSASLRRQPGEISFPGGHVEEQDVKFENTAIRETSEELGVPQHSVQLVGALDVLPASSNLLVYPFVGIISPEARLDPNPKEVAEVLSVSLHDLLACEPDVYEVREEPSFPSDFPFHLIPSGKDYPWRTSSHLQYFYRFDNFVVWGLTARILTHFLHVISHT